MGDTPIPPSVAFAGFDRAWKTRISEVPVMTVGSAALYARRFLPELPGIRGLHEGADVVAGRSNAPLGEAAQTALRNPSAVFEESANLVEKLNPSLFASAVMESRTTGAPFPNTVNQTKFVALLRSAAKVCRASV